MKKRPFDTFRTVLSGVKIPWIYMFVSLVSSFLLAGAMIKTAVITAGVIDSSGSLKTSDLISYIGWLLASGLLASGGSFCNSIMSQKINIGVRSKLWRKMLRLPMKYYDKESGESLVSRITIDCSRASSFIGVIIMGTSSVYGMYLAIKSMVSFSATLTLWSACLVPIVAIGVALTGKLVFRAQNRLHGKQADTTSYLLERVKNLRLVRSSNMSDQETAVGNGHFTDIYRCTVNAMLCDNLMASFMGITPAALIIITFIVGSVLLAKNEITMGTVIGFYSVSAMASIRISVMITVFGDLVAANGIFDKISGILKEEEEPTEGRPMDLPDESIVFDNVAFSYGERKIFSELSCIIPKNSITAIIGDNGAGKTTMFKLLERMYQPDNGEIRFGNVNCSEFSPTAWRGAFALVSQDRPIMSGTVRENITYGTNREISDGELECVARQAGIWELVSSLPNGFDTVVEANGGNFSGGQRQCMAIARAIMRNPDYLLLDEATSNLDAQSEREVAAALANLMRGRTTVMIAHSISAISHADNIIALKDGKVEAYGTPDEMAKKSVVFRDFISSQCMPQEG